MKIILHYTNDAQNPSKMLTYSAISLKIKTYGRNMRK